MKEKEKEILLQVPQNGEAVEMEVEVIKPQSPPAPPETSLDQIVAHAEQNVQLAKRLIQAALKMTIEADWVDQGGKPYLTHAGAEKIARRFGVCWENVRCWKEWSEDEKGRFYIYTFTGKFYLKSGDSIEAIGTCSQRDKFFSLSNGQPRPLSEIDETNIKKAAYSNLIVNGITHLLGLRSLSWDQLKEAGLNIDKIAKVEFKEAPKQESEEMKRKKEEIWKMALELANGDEELAKNHIKLASTFKSKKDGKVVTANSLDEINSDRWLNYTHHQLSTLLDQRIQEKNQRR
jgi:hypothetical protein